jgi:hypothetical protein
VSISRLRSGGILFVKAPAGPMALGEKRLAFFS